MEQPLRRWLRLHGPLSQESYFAQRVKSSVSLWVSWEIVVAKSSALRLDKPRPTYRATRIDADSCATQIRDNENSFGLALVIRLTGYRWLCQIFPIVRLM